MKPPLDLQEFIQILEEANELKRVTCEVDPYLEVAALIDQVCKKPGGGKALLFENSRDLSIELIDLTGKLLLKESWQNAQKGNDYSINVSDFADGVYFIRLYDETNSMTKRLVIRK